MSSVDLATIALELPPAERLELARRLIDSVEPDALALAISEGVKRIEDMASGRIPGLTEAEYRAASDEGFVSSRISEGHSPDRSPVRGNL